MGNNASAPPPGLEEEAEKICSVYRESAQQHTQKAFEKAFTECLNRRVHAEGAVQDFIDRRLTSSLEGIGMNNNQIRDELERQARQYACAEERQAFEEATKKTESDREAVRRMEEAFQACVAARTSDKEVEDYKVVYSKGLAALYVKKERNKELSNATRIHFSFGAS